MADKTWQQDVSTLPATGITDGRKVVTTAGTRVTLVAGSTLVRSVLVQALLENTGIIVVGGTAVVAAAGTRQGYALRAGDAVAIEIDDLQKVNIDSTVNGEGVSFMYVTGGS